MFFCCTVILSRLLEDTLRHQQKCDVISLCANCILRHLETSCFQALIQSPVSVNPTIVLFTIGSYVHSYKFEICIHNSLQNNGMALFVVKILADGVRRAMDSDVLCICPFNAIWKMPANIEVFRNFCKYFFCWRRLPSSVPSSQLLLKCSWILKYSMFYRQRSSEINSCFMVWVTLSSCICSINVGHWLSDWYNAINDYTFIYSPYSLRHVSGGNWGQDRTALSDDGPSYSPKHVVNLMNK